MIKKIEYWWRHHIVYPVLRRIFHNAEVNIPIDIQSIKSILILRYDRIGDMIVTTPFLSALKAANSSLRIGVFASRTNEEIIRHNPNVDIIHVLPVHWWQIWEEIKRAKKENYDIILNLVFNRTTSGGILSNLIAPEGIKIGQGNNKYKFYFNKLLSIERDSRRMIDILAAYFKEAVGVYLPDSKQSYEISISDEARKRIKVFLAQNHLRSRNTKKSNFTPYIVFNLSASDSLTRFAVQQVEKLGLFLNQIKIFKTVFIYAPADYEMKKSAEKMCSTNNCLVFPEKGIASLLEIAALVKGAHYVISPDTAIIHFASAMRTPVLGFYTSAKEKHEWLPYNVKYKILMSENRKPTSEIPIQDMIKALQEFILTNL